ncbi:TetR-like C-terminal domain-containing protein [Paenibacillus glufosinatiresistens]|uniref:TetR-like C-terminal domain-containing protein n=1 Tax=Paenibacillus glufosinatiresistens TaxID=3070657 RepID=UPI0038CD18B1
MAGFLRERNLEAEQEIHAVRSLRSLLHGFASLEGGGGFGFPLEVGTSLQMALRAYLPGLSPQLEGVRLIDDESERSGTD